MGQLWGTCIKRSKTEKDTRSPYKISQYVMEAVAEFIAGWTFMFLFFFVLTIYVGIPPDPTLTVSQSNEKNAILLSAMLFSGFLIMGLKGSFGQRLGNFFGNTGFTLMTATTAYLDARVRIKDFWILIFPFLYIACNIAGVFAGVVMFSAIMPSVVIPSTLVPVIANVVQGSYGWAILIGSTSYFLIFHVLLFTCNGTRHPYSNLWPLVFVTTICAFVQFITIRQFPSFAVNVGLSFMTGHYELLWVDVVNMFIGLVLTALLYWVMWAIMFEPDQALQVPSFQIPWDFSVSHWSKWRGFKKMRNAMYMARGMKSDDYGTGEIQVDGKSARYHLPYYKKEIGKFR